MTWADVVPNFLVGLREGLEAGLVVGIVLAAARKAESARDGVGLDGRETSTAPIWLGVLGAVMLTGSFAAVVNVSADVLSSRVQQQIADGLLSVCTAGLVTAMVFWLRRTAAALESALREGPRAAAVGAGVLTATAFLAVGRAGLETTLLVSTAVRAPGQTAGPLAGAAAGLAAAVLLCCLMYRWAIRLDAATFFTLTALALIVIGAGMLTYGLGDLQGASLLSGQRWIAFDVTAYARPGSWWVSLITGVTDLSPRMTVLQAVAWIGYLAVVVSAFAKARPAPGPGRTGPGRTVPGHAAPGHAARGRATQGTARWERLARGRPWVVAGIIIVIPAIAAAAAIAALPAAGAASTSTVTVTRTGCAPNWTSAAAGTQTFTVVNQSGMPGEINLDDASGNIVGEIETIGPGTSAQFTATLTSGTYVFKCFMGSEPATASAPVQVVAVGNPATANLPAVRAIAVKPVTARELAGPNEKYEVYAARQLALLAQAVGRIQADLRQGDLAAAKADWLTAQLDWERVGASYDSFGELGLAVDGLPDGLPGGVNDKHFTGLHRLEYGLWHGQSAATLLPVAVTLARDVAVVRQNLTTSNLAGDPANLPIRAHEILEDALRDHLSGIDNQGGGAAFAETYADMQVAKAVLGYLTPLLEARQPGLTDIADGQLDILRQALLATRVDGHWESLGTASLSAREHVDAAIGALLETLSAVPDLLEVPPVH